MVEPTLVAGRAPETADEIVLGARTRRRLGVEIGDTVRVEIGKTEHDFRVVGQGVFPEFGDAGQLGTGAYMTFDGVHRLLPTAPRNTYLVRYANRSAVDRERQLVASAVVPYPTREDARPQDLVDLARGDGLLGFLSVALALLALAVLVHALVTTTRNTRSRLRGAACARLVAAAGVVDGRLAGRVASWARALLVGIPLGLAVGQLAWERFATSLGIASGRGRARWRVGARRGRCRGDRHVGGTRACVAARHAPGPRRCCAPPKRSVRGVGDVAARSSAAACNRCTRS